MKVLTDVHTHSTFSHDGLSSLDEMFKQAHSLGVAFYGVSEHMDYDYCNDKGEFTQIHTDCDAYYHTARHLQEDYQGVMNVLVGAEFGYSGREVIQKLYVEHIEKYNPDFVVNSVHSMGNGMDEDYYFKKVFVKNGKVRDKEEVYTEYLKQIKKSLDAPYRYDIVAHVGYPARYGPYEDPKMHYDEYADLYDDILKTIIAKDKILEANSGGKDLTLAYKEVLQRYYQLGGRKVSFASDAHGTDRILRNREQVVEMLKEIGFTYITVPFKGEHIKVEI